MGRGKEKNISTALASTVSHCFSQNYLTTHNILLIGKHIALLLLEAIKFYSFCSQVVLTLGGSVLLGYLTEYITNANEETLMSPYIYAMGLSVSSYINLAMGNLTYHNGWMIALRIKIILTGAISQKVSHNNESIL